MQRRREERPGRGGGDLAAGDLATRVAESRGGARWRDQEGTRCRTGFGRPALAHGWGRGPGPCFRDGRTKHLGPRQPVWLCPAPAPRVLSEKGEKLHFMAGVKQ